MLTNQQLVDKAHSAILDYKRIYGKYPSCVGIDWDRLQSMTTTQLAFPELTRALPTVFSSFDDQMPSVHMEMVRFAPVTATGGTKISPDEVYLPRPKDYRKGISGTALARLCNLIKIRRERIVYAPLHLRLESSEQITGIIERLRDEPRYTKEYYGAFLG